MKKYFLPVLTIVAMLVVALSFAACDGIVFANDPAKISSYYSTVKDMTNGTITTTATTTDADEVVTTVTIVEKIDGKKTHFAMTTVVGDADPVVVEYFTEISDGYKYTYTTEDGETWEKSEGVAIEEEEPAAEDEEEELTDIEKLFKSANYEFDSTIHMFKGKSSAEFTIDGDVLNGVKLQINKTVCTITGDINEATVEGEETTLTKVGTMKLVFDVGGASITLPSVETEAE